MKTGIDPKVDVAFRRGFSSRGRHRPLLALINAVLAKRGGTRIARLRVRNPFDLRRQLDGKTAILDILAEDAAGQLINLEMQMRVPAHYPGRILFYWSGQFRSQLRSGQGYDRLRKTISIHFVAEDLWTGIAEYHTCFVPREVNLGFSLGDYQEIHVVELNKLRGLKLADLKTDMERWCYVLLHGAELDPADLPAELRDPTIREFLEALEEMGRTPIERELYEAQLKAERDHITDLNHSRAVGLAEGEARGEARTARAMLHEFLEFRFGAAGVALLTSLDPELDAARLRGMFRQAKVAGTPTELAALWTNPDAPAAS